MPKKFNIKRRQRVPIDAKWCSENVNNLTPQKSFEQFNYDDQSKGNKRYRHIIHKWIEYRKEAFSVLFWKDRCIWDSTTIFEDDSEHEEEDIPRSRWIVNDTDISELLFDYKRKAISMISTPGLISEKNITCFNMLLVFEDHHNNLQSKYFDDTLLEMLKECTLFDNTFTMRDAIYLLIPEIVYGIQRDAFSLELGVIKILELSLKEEVTIYEKNLLKGIASMINFFPKKRIDITKLGESELWSTYYNPLLTAIISKPEDNMLLRWTNKAAENYTSKRPDAIINVMNGHENVYLGYGECKLGYASKKLVNMDIIKLAIFTQRTININNKQNVFSFHIEGFKVIFFVTSIENEHVYAMKKIGEVVLPCCLDDLPSFINMKTIKDILQITKYFWELCNTDLDATQISWKKETEYDKYLGMIASK